ncbi:MAG: hypothetical protein HYY13_06440 [Nitrospirae bacterium]|nr:hypothetical protein [Nitrospirota bacterium]
MTRSCPVSSRTRPAGHGFGPVLLLLFVLSGPTTTSCGAAAFFTTEEAVKPSEALNPNVTIRTGDHVHVFPKTFVANAELLASHDRADWEKAREYFRKAQQDPSIASNSAAYGEFAADFLITLDDLNEVTTSILKLFGMEGAPARDVFFSNPPSFDLPSPAPARRHPAGDMSHGVIEDIMNIYLLNTINKNIPRLDAILGTEDFMFPAKSVTLGFSAAGVTAAGEFVGYHNKAVALYLRDLLYLIGMASNAVTSLRFNSINLIKQATSGLSITAMLDSFFEGNGGKQTTRILNSDPTFLTFFPEHLSQVKDLLFAYLLASGVNETVLNDDPGHYADSFMAFLDAEGYLNLRSTGEATATSGVFRLGKIDPTATSGASEALRLHLADPARHPYVNAAEIFGPLLGNLSAGFNSIVSQAVVSSLTSGAGGSSENTEIALNGLLDTVASLVEFVSGVQLGVNKSVFYVDLHQLFRSIENLRNYLPAWTRPPGSNEGYFFEEFECGLKAPSSALKIACPPGEPLTDSSHFSEVPLDQLGVGTLEIGGLRTDDPDFATLWGEGAPKDGKKSPYGHFLWQDPGFGAAVWVDPTALDWSRFGVTLPPGTTVPCGVKPEMQQLRGPSGVCLMNLLVDVLAVGS